MAGRKSREEQVHATREALLAAAERLFAEHGVHEVANRQISLAAGHGNNTAVNYHFGAKTDLIRAIVRKHVEQIEAIRMRLMSEIGDSSDLRAWVTCLVYPFTEHLEILGSPTWCAPFMAHLMANPALSAIVTEESLAAAPSLRDFEDGLARCLPDLPPPFTPNA